MKLHSKNLFHSLFLYGFTGAFPSIINILILPFIEGPSKLNAVDFSQIAIAESIVVFGWLIASFSGGNVISRFYYDFIDSKHDFNQFISSFFMSIVARGLLLCLLFYFLADIPGRFFTQPNLQSFSVYGPVAVLIGTNRSLNTAFTALLRNQKKIFLYTGFNITAGLLRAAGQILGLFFIEMSFKGYLYGILITSLLTGISILIYIFYKYGIYYHRKILKQLNTFALPIFYYEILLWLMTYADRYFLEKYPVDLGLYETITRFSLGVRLIIQGFNNAVQPETYSYFKTGIKQMEKSIRQVANIFMLISQSVIVISIIPVMLYLYYLCDSNIKAAYTFVPVIMILLILKSQFMIFTAPVLYHKDSKLLLYANIIGATLAISINLLLIPYIKIYAPILAIGVSDLFLIWFIKIFENKKYKINWNFNKTFFYPVSLVVLSGLLEILKIKFHINPFTVALILNLVFVLGIVNLYRVEIKKTAKKISPIFNPSQKH